LALVVGQNLTEEMKMREKAEGAYKVYSERQGLFTQDDIDYLRLYQQSLGYPVELQKKITKSIEAIKIASEEEAAVTRKRLRTLYVLLGGALISLIIAVALGAFAFNEQKKADSERKTAVEALTNLEKANQARNKAEADKQEKEVIDAEKRVNSILSIGGCPEEILKKMDALVSHLKELDTIKGTHWQAKIDSVRSIQNCN
jgi:hypothetical protein